MPPRHVQAKREYNCTACEGVIKSSLDAKLHPLIDCLICRSCYTTYADGDFAVNWDDGVDEYGDDNYCRWCCDGGELFGCMRDAIIGERCHYNFCKECIARNNPTDVILTLDQLTEEEKEKIKWLCYSCDKSKLAKLHKEAKDALKDLIKRTEKKPVSSTPAANSTPKKREDVSTTTPMAAPATPTKTPSIPASKKRKTEDNGQKPTTSVPTQPLTRRASELVTKASDVEIFPLKKRETISVASKINALQNLTKPREPKENGTKSTATGSTPMKNRDTPESTNKTTQPNPAEKKGEATESGTKVIVTSAGSSTTPTKPAEKKEGSSESGFKVIVTNPIPLPAKRRDPAAFKSPVIQPSPAEKKGETSDNGTKSKTVAATTLQAKKRDTTESEANSTTPNQVVESQTSESTPAIKVFIPAKKPEASENGVKCTTIVQANVAEKRDEVNGGNTTKTSTSTPTSTSNSITTPLLTRAILTPEKSSNGLSQRMLIYKKNANLCVEEVASKFDTIIEMMAAKGLHKRKIMIEIDSLAKPMKEFELMVADIKRQL